MSSSLCHDLLADLCRALALDLEEAREQARKPENAQLPADRFLVQVGLADESRVARALAGLFHLDFVLPDGKALDPKVQAMIPPEVARNFEIVPLAIEDGVLVLAMADPLDVVAEDVVRLRTGYPVRRVVATRSRIKALLNGEGGEPPEVDDLIGQLSGEEVELLGSVDDTRDEGEAYGEQDAPIIQLVNALLVDAIGVGASDVHVEPQPEGMRVRYRVDGVLRVVCLVPRKIQNACISRLKLVSGMDISEKRRPQDGRTRVRVGQRSVDLRASTLPSTWGEKVVLRILDRDAELVELEHLGMAPADLERYGRMFRRPQGLLLITGPTGSGKTSTLYSTLREINRTTDNLVTVEDPVEVQLPGITQVQVNPRAGVTFASALRSILRQDPDVIMVGEIRDTETAEIAFQSAQTGHLVLSTLHTNSAAATIVRLGQIGIPAYLVGDCLLGVVAQRLVRRLCPSCRQEAAPDPASWRDLARAGVTPPPSCWSPVGCEACSGTGYRGRTGLYEVVPVTPGLKQAILQGRCEAELVKVAREDGARALLDDGLDRVASGETSLEELLRVVALEPVAEERVSSGICDFARKNSRRGHGLGATWPRHAVQ